MNNPRRNSIARLGKETTPEVTIISLIAVVVKDGSTVDGIANSDVNI